MDESHDNKTKLTCLCGCTHIMYIINLIVEFVLPTVYDRMRLIEVKHICINIK